MGKAEPSDLHMNFPSESYLVCL